MSERPSIRERLLSLPKTDLHVHLDGSLRPATMLELALEYGVPMPSADAHALYEHMVVRDARNLVDYLARFDTTLSVMQTAESLERVAYELAEDSAAENVRYLEVRFSPVLSTRAGLTMHEVVDATLAGLRRAEAEYDIRTGVIICALRHMSPDTSLALARVALDFKDRGVVAFDLAGPEDGEPPKKHLGAFQLVADGNLGLTIHAGEAFGAASIHQAVHTCHANRIGHGTRLFEDPELLRWVTDFRVPIEVCLTSNVQTRATDSYAAHPLRQYFDAGAVLALSTDNRLMSGTTMTDEYLHAHEALGFDWDELRALARSGFEAAFLPLREKQALLRRMDREIAGLWNGLEPPASGERMRG
jgi:adenosine deaminase